MSTIAYRDGVIAADTQISADNEILGHATKIGKRGRVLFGASGDASWMREFLVWARGGFVGGPPESKGEGGGSALVIADGRLMSVYASGHYDEVRAVFYAVGSGRQFARGAMATGATAEDAVRAAILLDACSGGDVEVLHL